MFFGDPPDLTKATFIAPNATVLGRVTVQAGVSIWYGAVVRADVERIALGRLVNIQDGAILHGDPGLITQLGDHVTVGHRAVIHSAIVGTGSLIGIGAILLSGVTLGEGCIVAAGAVVTKSASAHSLLMGVPARVIRSVTMAQAAELIHHAEQYHQLALAHARLLTT
ncbi:gamma carbonic anhydrase family protein [Candidatus Cyanaurora vandensis]|uniref:gamma carbonic anhydrase family protein n=1 Tax=Candidatus Cyanaurora vandensis TaxID=2714958 RepID=UPI00257A67D0|nr:gamma carbonic anhydrase family protein [Candidatus Cyanaurora vandensis]